MAVEYQFWTGNQMYSEYGLFIGNGWRNAEGGATAEVRSPVTEQVLGRTLKQAQECGRESRVIIDQASKR